MIEDGKKIADNIRAERNRVKLSQEEVAKYLDISLKTYIKYEANARTIKATDLMKLATLFKCNIDNFFV